jgi:dUTP pyrophosphatase
MANLNENLLEFKFTKLRDDAEAPEKSHGDIGWDLRCVKDEKFSESYLARYLGDSRKEALSFELESGNRHVFHTGISIELPSGYHAILKPRSGLAVKHGIDVLAGVIDSSYRGELMVCLHNNGREAHRIYPGDKIAQMIIIKECEGEFIQKEELSETTRGTDGFGSTGR